MSKIKNGGLDQYGAKPFEQQEFRTPGVERGKKYTCRFFSPPTFFAGRKLRPPCIGIKVPAAYACLILLIRKNNEVADISSTGEPSCSTGDRLSIYSIHRAAQHPTKCSWQVAGGLT